MKNSMIFKRVGAYLIDFLVIMLINSAIAYIGFINPKYDEYKEYSEEYSTILNDYYEKRIDINDFNDKVSNMAYDLNYNGYVYIIGDIVVAFLYFGVFQYATKGQTLGKKILNIKVVGNKKDLKLYNYFIRTFILNGVILNIITFIAVWLGRDNYYKVYNLATNIDYLLMIAIFLTVMLTPEGRGLHDILAGTKVIDAKEDLAVKEGKRIVEAEEIKEVQNEEDNKIEEPKKELDVKDESKELKVEEVKSIKKKSSAKKTPANSKTKTAKSNNSSKPSTIKNNSSSKRGTNSRVKK